MSGATKLSLLRALIDHPGTPEHERDTARRLYQRLSSARPGPPDPYARTYGPKAEALPRTAPVREIAALIRKDLRLARRTLTDNSGNAVALVEPIASAPPEVEFTVRTVRGSAIHVDITNVPDGWFSPGERLIGASGRTYFGYTPWLVELVEAVEEIHDAYNWDGSDPSTDHFDRRYTGSVTAARRPLS